MSIEHLTYIKGLRFVFVSIVVSVVSVLSASVFNFASGSVHMGAVVLAMIFYYEFFQRGIGNLSVILLTITCGLTAIGMIFYMLGTDHITLIINSVIGLAVTTLLFTLRSAIKKLSIVNK